VAARYDLRRFVPVDGARKTTERTIKKDAHDVTSKCERHTGQKNDPSRLFLDSAFQDFFQLEAKKEKVE
jgi:hypothetical protein